MSKGISHIIIPAKAIQTQQMVEFPTLLNGCKVYGLRTNNKEVPLSVEMPEEARLQVYELQKKGYHNSGIKWVYGKVHNLKEHGIEWYYWYQDLNRNKKHDDGEPIYKNKPLKDICGKDLYQIQGAYKRSEGITLSFDETRDYMPCFYWVEAFLVHPELYLSKEPKGFFIVPIDTLNSKIYRTDLTIKNRSLFRDLDMFLPPNKEESDTEEHIVYYGEEIIFTAHTLLMPSDATIAVEIIRNEFVETNGLWAKETKFVNDIIYEGKAHLEPEDDFLGMDIVDPELFDYIEPYLKKAVIPIALTVDKKPEHQSQNQKVTFLVNINHFYTAIGPPTPYNKIFPVLNGYLTIEYSDMNTILENRNKEVDKFVQKRPLIYIQSEGEPCGYTKIEAQKFKKFDKKKGHLDKNDGETTILFEENAQLESVPVPQLDIIAGEESPVYLKISANLPTENQCKDEIHTKGASSVFYFPDGLSAKKQRIEYINIDYDFIELAVPYQYIHDNKFMGIEGTFPFNYFWLTEEDVQKHVLMVETCRYKTPVKINVYPDIEWSIALKVGSVQPEVYSHTNMPTANNHFKDHHQKAIEAGQNKKWLNKEVFFELSLKVETNDIETEYSARYEQKVKKILQALVSIKEKLDNACHVTEAKKGMAKNIAKKLPGKLKNLPITLQIDYPVIAISGSWKWNFDDYGKIEKNSAITLGFTPLIKATGKIDLIACAEYIPQARAFIKAAKWAAEKLNGEIWINLYASGEVNLNGTIYLNQKKKVEDFNCNTTVTIGIELGAKVSKDLEGVVFEAERKFEGELSARGETAVTLAAKRGFDDKGIYTEINADFGGLKAYVTVKARFGRWEGGVDNKVFTLVDPVPDLFKKKFYIISEEK